MDASNGKNASNNTWWKVLPGARLGCVLPVGAAGPTRDESLFLDPDHLEGITVAPLPAVMAL